MESQDEKVRKVNLELLKIQLREIQVNRVNQRQKKTFNSSKT